MQTKHSTALTVTVVEISKLGLQAETTSREQDDRFLSAALVRKVTRARFHP